MADTEYDKEHTHPGVGQYVEIGVILAVLTLMEVILYESFSRGFSKAVGFPALIVLTVLKFALVVLWFMHLRFDHKLFRRLFLAGLSLAFLVFGIVAAVFYLGGVGF